MPTPAEQALSEGFDALTEVFDPQGSWTFGGASFAGVASPLQPGDPHMTGSGDRMFELEVRVSDLPDPRPTRGDTIERDGTFYRVTRVLDIQVQTGRARFIIAIE